MVKCFFVSFFILTVLGCSNPEKKKLDQKHKILVDRSKSAIHDFGSQLKKTLMEEIAQKGVVGAVESCADKAQKLSVLNSSQHPGVLEIGRTTHKLRSPLNAPLLPLSAILDKMKDSSADRPAKNRLVQVKGERQWYFAQPIYMESSCLACHGGSLAPQVESFLDQRYIQDQARDYKEGDFRGVFWVKIQE